MKQTKTKLLCLILAALMLLSGLTACGKDKEGKDSNLIKLGDYELLYKGAMHHGRFGRKRRNRSDTGLHKQQQGKRLISLECR